MNDEDQEMQTTLNSMTVSDYKAMQGDIMTFKISGDRKAVLAALRSAHSRNAVLRAQSRATLTFYSQLVTTYASVDYTLPVSDCFFSPRRDPNYVERLRTFNSDGHQ